MKISVLGKIIDTENIYMIHEVVVEQNYLQMCISFTIESFDNKVFKVLKDVGNYMCIWNRYTTINPTDASIKKPSDYNYTKYSISYDEFIKTRVYTEVMFTITNIRNQIAEIWGANLSKIIQINEPGVIIK